MCVLIFYTVCMWLNRESVSGLILSVYPRQQCILMPKKEKKKCISSACTFPHPISVCVLFVYACLLSLCAQSAVRGNTPTSLSYQPRSSRLAGADQKHGSPIGQQRKRQQFVAVAKILLLGSRLLLGDVMHYGWLVSSRRSETEGLMTGTSITLYRFLSLSFHHPLSSSCRHSVSIILK